MSRRAAFAFAIVSRKAAEDAGTFGEPVGSVEVCGALFEGDKDVRVGFVASVEWFLVALFAFGAGFAKASWTDGRAFEGRAAKVLLPLSWVELDLPVIVLPALQANTLLPNAGNPDFDGVDSRVLWGFLLEGGKLLGAYELTARLLGVVIGI